MRLSSIYVLEPKAKTICNVLSCLQFPLTDSIGEAVDQFLIWADNDVLEFPWPDFERGFFSSSDIGYFIIPSVSVISWNSVRTVKKSVKMQVHSKEFDPAQLTEDRPSMLMGLRSFLSGFNLGMSDYRREPFATNFNEPLEKGAQREDNLGFQVELGRQTFRGLEELPFQLQVRPLGPRKEREAFDGRSLTALMEALNLRYLQRHQLESLAPWQAYSPLEKWARKEGERVIVTE